MTQCGLFVQLAMLVLQDGTAGQVHKLAWQPKYEQL